MYAEAPHATTSAVTLQRTDRQGMLGQKPSVCKRLCDNSTQRGRRMAQQTGLSKRSVHRLRQAMARRGGSPESWWWETEDSRRWLTRCVVATLYPFGLPRGVGRDTSSAFFAHLHRAWPIRL